MPKVSVIICVYNAEKTLDKCLKSILGQELQDIEVICVNDGSEDSSLDILRGYAQLDSRIQIINQENQGPFIGRKNGCLRANSPYVVFCDSDDWLLPKALLRLYHAISTYETDISIARQYASVNGVLYPSFLNNELLIKYREAPFTLQDSGYALFFGHASLHAKIFKKHIFLRACETIKTDARNGEDMLALFASYLISDKVSLVYDFAYVYKQDNSGSLTHQDSSISDNCKSYRLLFSYIDSLRLDDKELMTKIIGRKFCATVLWLMSKKKNISLNEKKSIKSILLEIRCCSDSTEYKKLRRAVRVRLSSCLPALSILIPKFTKTKDYRILDFLGKRWSFPRTAYKKYLDLRENISDLYEENLKRLKSEARNRKIRVCFYVSEKQKWQTENLYRIFRNSNRYECFFVYKHGATTSKEDNLEFFKNHDAPVYFSSEKEPKDFDLIFYQQPWDIDKKWQVLDAAKTCLTCYVPYCVYCLDSPNNNFNGFHNVLWRYFTDSAVEAESGCLRNKLFLGSTKLESLVDRLRTSSVVKKEKIKIVYAPHHSFGVKSHRMATWDKFGIEILKLAEENQGMEWIFRPHPRFAFEVQANRLATFQELYSYYARWEQIGRVDCSSSWEDLLADCDLLITDCISFLFDFSVTNKPVMHLRSLYQKEAFSEHLLNIVNNYMQVYDVEQLQDAFSTFKSSECWLKEERDLINLEDNKDLAASNDASKKIFDYINGQIYDGNEV